MGKICPSANSFFTNLIRICFELNLNLRRQKLAAYTLSYSTTPVTILDN